MGPILIFDKSTLHALSVDECVWLGRFYNVNITPIYFAEVIADLEKEVAEGKKPEDIVARLTVKTTALESRANVHHVKMCPADLMGNAVDMHGVPVLEGGRPVAQKGKKGLVFSIPPETKMLDRWRGRKFHDAEREMARAWRASLENLDLDRTYETFRKLVERAGKPKDFAAAKGLADSLLGDLAQAERMLGLAFMSLGIPHELWGRIFDRWKAAGRPVLSEVAPYAAHVMSVEMFFSIAVGSDLISKERPSNKVDIAYLNYLPFCTVFSSGDWLHETTVPLFLTGKQLFVRAADLKADLKKLDEHYDALPEDTKKRGTMSFAPHPPFEGGFLVTELWDRFMSPIWREPKDAKPARDPELERKLVREMRNLRRW